MKIIIPIVALLIAFFLIEKGNELKQVNDLSEAINKANGYSEIWFLDDFKIIKKYQYDNNEKVIGETKKWITTAGHSARIILDAKNDEYIDISFASRNGRTYYTIAQKE